jgi:hypothetical protein
VKALLAFLAGPVEGLPGRPCNAPPALGFPPSRLYLIMCAGEFPQEIFAIHCSLNGMLVRE